MRNVGPVKALPSHRNLSWYAQRLRVMGPVEVLHRVTEHCTLKALEAQYWFGWLQNHRIAGDATRFSFCSGFAQRLPELPWSFEIDDAAIEALLSGKLLVSGHEWIWSSHHSVWHEAPDTRRQ